ncbi:hypothetical protein CH063_15561 [Colletotrichum higginsianum]|uniref:Uncharacterized protein n=1 Tax=Colletotrichum higginsianum (strain IMI 349063) TaxID=759273 RepID=H1W3D9_COLHI|nr:hypothetical protein CH063_15561 [Colletotrichum higginsianum]
MKRCGKKKKEEENKKREIHVVVVDLYGSLHSSFPFSQDNFGIETDKTSDEKRPMDLRDSKDFFLPGMPRKPKGVLKEEDQTNKTGTCSSRLSFINSKRVVTTCIIGISDRPTSLGATRRLAPQKARQYIAQGGRSNTASVRASSLGECAWRSTPNPGAHRSTQQAVHDVWERGGSVKLRSACMRHR